MKTATKTPLKTFLRKKGYSRIIRSLAAGKPFLPTVMGQTKPTRRRRRKG